MQSAVAAAAELLVAELTDPSIPPSGFSAATLAYLDQVGKDSPSPRLDISDDDAPQEPQPGSPGPALDSPEKPRSSDSSLHSWLPVAASPSVSLCVVKRFQGPNQHAAEHVDLSALDLAARPKFAPPFPKLLQATPKQFPRHSARSRSPKAAGTDLLLSSGRVADHRHRMGLGHVTTVPPSCPFPAPPIARRSRSLGFVPAPALAPPLPLPKNRAAYYASHTRGPEILSASPPVVATVPSSGPSGPLVSASAAPPRSSSLTAPHDSGLPAKPLQPRLGLNLQHSLHAAAFASALLVWHTIRPLLLPFSPVLQDLQASQHRESLELGLLRTVSDTTVVRYLNVVQRFLEQLQLLWLLTWDRASQSQVVDCILSLRRDFVDCHCVNTLKGLRWAAKLLRLQVADLYDGLVRPLCLPSEKPRKESYPLPWRLVSFLEHALMHRTLPVPSLLMAGAALVCVFGSLRWSDSQHVRWDSLLFSSSCLRALVYRTKTSRAGMPVALVSSGLLGSSSDPLQTWLGHYLELLSEVWVAMRESFGQAVCPDCLWFAWSAEQGSFSPLNYAQCLRFLREMAVQAGLVDGIVNAQALTLHSCKVAMLSAMLVLGLPKPTRSCQGHHRGSSAELYSRDDVWEALQGQGQVVSQLRSGWLPLTPLARGGQRPVAQLPLLPRSADVPAAAPAAAFPLLHDFSVPSSLQAASEPLPAIASGDSLKSPLLAAEETLATPLPLQNSAVAQTSEVFDSSSDEEDAPGALGCPEEVIFLRARSGIFHLASQSPSAAGVPLGKVWLKPCCGMLSTDLEVAYRLPAEARLCRHRACQALLQQCA